MIIFALVLLYLVFFILNTQSTVWPEMVTYPYLANHGFLLYKDIGIPYTPILVWFLQIAEGFFGYTPQVVIGIIILNATINLLLVWVISKKIWVFSKFAPLLSILFYGLWFFYLEGNGFWFDIFEVPFVLGAFYFMYCFLFREKKTSQLIWGVIFLSLALLIKQSALWMTLVSGLMIVIVEFGQTTKLIRSLTIFIVSFLAPILVTCAVFLIQGNLNEYLFWAYQYTYLIMPFAKDAHSDPRTGGTIKLTMILLGLVPLFVNKFKEFKELLFMLGFLAASFMFTYPRWEIFHLQPFLAVLSVIGPPLLASYLFRKEQIRKVVIAGLVIYLLVSSLIVGRQLQRFWQKPIRFFEPEIYQVAKIIREKGYTSAVVYNSHDQLYPLLNMTVPVRLYVQNFATFMVDVPDIQERLIEEFEKSKPKYVIYTPVSGRGGVLPGDFRPEKFGNYIDQNYILKEKLPVSTWILERKIK